MKTLSFLLITFFSFLVYSQDEIKIDSKVTAATVFKNRALVTREAQQYLSAGKHTLIFSNLSSDLQNESVRVSAEGNGVIKILDVKVEQRFTAEMQQENIKALERKIDSLNQIKKVAMDEIAVYESKREFVEALKAQSSKYLNEKMLLNVNSTKEWNDILKYVETNLKDIYRGLREQNEKKTLIEQQIRVVEMEMNQLKGRQSKNYKEIIVIIENERNGNVLLYPSYIAQNTSWYPVYDARVITDSKEVEISYFGMVHQTTGEDWNDISLTLSTAEPLTIKSLPQIEPWYVDIKPLPVKQKHTINQNKPSGYEINYEQNMGLPAGTGSITGYVTDGNTGENLIGANIMIAGTKIGSTTDLSGKFLIPNIKAGLQNIIVSYIGYNQINTMITVPEQNVVNLVFSMEAKVLSGEEVVIRGLAKGQLSSVNQQLSRDVVPYSNVYAKELSTSFEIPARTSIPSDNSRHKITIAIDRASVEFSYTSIPKINPAVYLKGKIVNNNNYPLLAGETNVFVDNEFINRTSIKTIVTTDTLELALGIDNKIQIKKELINKFQESKGFLGGSRQITYDYEIQITNNRTTEESIIIYDQIPIAMNEDITIELLEPKKSEKELGNDKKLEWNVKLKPGERKIISLKYLVKYPNNNSVYNLE